MFVYYIKCVNKLFGEEIKYMDFFLKFKLDSFLGMFLKKYFYYVEKGRFINCLQYQLIVLEFVFNKKKKLIYIL